VPPQRRAKAKTRRCFTLRFSENSRGIPLSGSVHSKIRVADGTEPDRSLESIRYRNPWATILTDILNRLRGFAQPVGPHIILHGRRARKGPVRRLHLISRSNRSGDSRYWITSA